MSVSSINSGYQLIQRANSLSEEAAKEVADEDNFNNLEFNKIDSKELSITDKKPPPSTLESLTKLQQAKTYNQVGASVVQSSNDIIGTILDTHI